ncbi:MAG: putative manganese-dependent inorganic diphosphatase, partial [Chthoniobacteraceae bacterium]
AARAGATNERIDFVLSKFGIPAPLLVTDLSPKIVDVMEPNVISVRADSPVYDAIQLMEQKRLRGLPVVDENRCCVGLLSASKITHHLFPARDEAARARLVTASLADIVTTFGGALVTGSLTAEPMEQLLMVGAMDRDSFAPRLRKYAHQRVILFVGDRPQIQQLAIDERVHAIVVTGGLPVPEDIRAQARGANVTIISSPHDTATTVLLSRGAVRVEQMLETEFVSFHPDTPRQEARRIAAESASFIFPVLEKDDTLVGILSKSDFLNPIPRQLILVDHNELTQAVKGADKVPIIEILDHHKIGGFETDTPILFWNNPVGSTSSIVAMCYQQAGIPIPPPIAGLLMAGLISDTLQLTSPTATAADRAILEQLEKITGVSPADLAAQIFSVGSPLLTMAPEQAIVADSKLYEEDEHQFTVAQIEELTFAHFPEKRDALLAALEQHRVKQGLLFAALLVTDINTQTSLLLVRGAQELLETIDYPQDSQFVWELAGVVSRKKQLLPFLLKCLERMRSATS